MKTIDFYIYSIYKIAENITGKSRFQKEGMNVDYIFIERWI